MRLPKRVDRPRGRLLSGEPPADEEWSVGPASHKTAIILVAIGLAALIVVATIVVAFPSVINDYFAPPPLWHSFNGVFNTSGRLSLEGCTVNNLQPVIGGLGGTMVSTSVVVCSYRGATYTGYYGRDCNLQPSGPIPSINGSLVPYDGCVLSTAPLNEIFEGIYSLAGKPTNGSIEIYSNNQAVANIIPGGNWTAYHCSLQSDNATRTTGQLNCSYLGIPYGVSDVPGNCNLGTPIQVNGVPIPPDSCNLQRAEVVSG